MIVYGERILDHYRHPRNSGFLATPDISHEDVNPLCGDRVRIELALTGGEIVREARFRADSCIISQAASSILTEMVTGRTLKAIETLPPSELLQALKADIPSSRLECALLPFHVLKAGITAYKLSSAS
ncbi:MAG: iron-sulfur cluster assembly scaffold protein [Candidatus Methylomirabilales bacterium]